MLVTAGQGHESTRLEPLLDARLSHQASAIGIIHGTTSS
jgi:hypothetical protein